MSVETATPAYKVLLRWSTRWATRRLAELEQAHGIAPSEGVEQLVEDEATARRIARYFEQKGAESDNVENLAKAASLLTEARTWAKDAWELAAREAPARKKAKLPAWHEDREDEETP